VEVLDLHGVTAIDRHRRDGPLAALAGANYERFSRLPDQVLIAITGHTMQLTAPRSIM